MGVSLPATLRMFGRFARDLGPFLRRPLTLEEARAVIRERLDRREENFLRLVERGVFGHPGSPYLPLLRAAGCGFPDLRRMVLRDGLEPALGALRGAGVFVTLEEFKGRRPIERGGVTLRVGPHDFDNPFVRAAYRTETGGSTGAGARVSTDLGQLEVHASHAAVHLDAHGVLGAPTGLWTGILPDGSGVNNLLRLARIDMPVDRWFTPSPPGRAGETVPFRLATLGIVAMMRLHGRPAPFPETVEPARAGDIARWVRRMLDRHGSCFLKTGVSRCLRVSLAAREAGVDLSGAVFCGGGEPVSRAKAEGVAACGARLISTYSFTEAGPAALSCASPSAPDDVHLAADALAVVTHPRALPGGEGAADALSFTTLLPSASKLMLNVDLDDGGILGRRSCGCSLEEVGFHEHLSRVRSVGRVTVEGVALPAGEVTRVMEEVLPGMFGGSLLDWQLVEEEDDRGVTRLTILADPRLPGIDEGRVVEAFLRAVAAGSFEGRLSGELWRTGGNVRLLRQAPLLTGRGKHFSLRRAAGREAPPPSGCG